MCGVGRGVCVCEAGRALLTRVPVWCAWHSQALPTTRHSIETLDAQLVQESVTNVLVTGKIVVCAFAQWRLRVWFVLAERREVRCWAPCPAFPSSFIVLCVFVCACVPQLEGQENPLMFAQIFHIVVDATGPHVAADIFRLNYA
jgi:hypothetical protein